MSSHSSTQKSHIKITGSDALEFVDSIWLSAEMHPTAAKINPATSKPDYEAFIGDTKAYMFAGSGGETMTFEGVLPYSYKIGSTFYPHVHWSPTTTASGTVNWTIKATYATVDQPFGTALVTLEGTSTLTGTSMFTHQHTELDTYSFSSCCTMFSVALSRETDTYPDDVALLSIGVKYECDMLGRRHIDSK